MITVIDKEVQMVFETVCQMSSTQRAAWFEEHKTVASVRHEVEELLRYDGLAEEEAFFTPRPIANQPDSLLGSQVGPYEVISMIGRGGMGSVYLARRRVPYEQDVALKVADLRIGSGAARFDEERQVLADLHHPGIAKLLDGGVLDDDRPYLVMEYVPGEHIDDFAEKHKLRVMERVQLWLKVCEAVGSAHERGIIHRDLKPSNILVTAERSVVVVDFGLARRWEQDSGLTRTATILGTPEYMAPEQASGRKQQTLPATDVYALGAVLYTLLTGRPPFRAESPLQLVNILLQDDPVPPRRLNLAVPRDLETICLKCLEKEPVKRYATATELGDDVIRLLRGELIQARPLSMADRAWRWARRRPALAGLLALLLATIIVSLMVVWNYWRTSNKALQLAKRATTEQFLSIVELAKQPAMQRAQADFLSKWIASQEELVRSLDDEPIYLQFLRARHELAAAYGRIGEQSKMKEIASQLLSEIEAYSQSHHSDELSIAYAQFCSMARNNWPNQEGRYDHYRLLSKAIDRLKTVPESSLKTQEAKGLIADYRITLARLEIASVNSEAELQEAHRLLAELEDQNDPQWRIRYCTCKMAIWAYYLEKGQWLEHLQLLEDAVKLDRKLGQDYQDRLDYRDTTRKAMFLWANTLEWRGEWQRAYDLLLEYTELADQLRKNNPDTIRYTAQSAGSYMVLGQRAYALGMKDVAEKHYALAIQLSNKCQAEMKFDCLTGMAKLLAECPILKLRNDKLALELCRQASRLSPEDENVWFHEGRCLLLNGQLAEARKCLERSLIKINTDFELAYAHSYLALTLAKMGEYDLARKELAVVESFRARYPKEIVMLRVYEETVRELEHQATR